MEFLVRQIQAEDFEPVWKVGDRAYVPRLPESFECFCSKFRAYPKGCLSCVVRGQIVGYGISHPWKGNCVPLNTVISDAGAGLPLPEDPDCYYFHDFSILPEFQGKGLGAALASVGFNIALSNGFREIRLVSVNRSKAFWMKMGFLATRMTEYGPDIDGNMVPAYCMSKTFTPVPL